MRKSRANNGYIGKSRLDYIGPGSIAAQKQYSIHKRAELGQRDGKPYIRPNNGNGYGATATLTTMSNAELVGVKILNRGSGYVSAPAVTFTGGGGSGAEGIAVLTSGGVSSVTLWHTVYDVEIVHGGIGYTSTPTITFAAPGGGGTTATGTVTITNGKITSVTITNNGSRYTVPPAITISASGSTVPAALVAKIRCGSGYTSPPTISFDSGTASAEAILIGDLDTITVNTGGSGYTEAPTVFIEGSNGVRATLTATLSGDAVNSISISEDSRKFQTPVTIKIGGWKPLPSVSSGDHKFVGVHAIYPIDTTLLAIKAAGAFSVDWGDGSTGDYSSGSVAGHTYSNTLYDDLTDQDDFRGYKTVVVQVTMQSGQTFTQLDLSQKHSSYTHSAGLNVPSTGWLDIKMAGSSVNNLKVRGAYSVFMVNSLLEQFDYVGTNSITDHTYQFSSCGSLKKVVNLDLSTAQSVGYLFNNCNSLIELPESFGDTSNLTGTSYMFASCNSLPKVLWFETKNCTSALAMFSGCNTLARIPFYNFSKSTSFSNTFQGCSSLIEIPPIDTSKATTVQAMFSGCNALTTIPPIDTSNSTNFSSMFYQCYSLKYVPKLNTGKATDTNYMFHSCSSLTEAPELNISASTNTSSMFQNCYSLVRIPFYDTSSSTNFSSMFSSCYSLETVPALDLSNSTSCSGMFQNCYSLRAVPSVNAPKCSNATSMFNTCRSLVEIGTLKFNVCINFNSMFSYASSLTKAPIIQLIPESGTISTTAYVSMFSNCASLVDVSGLTFAQTANTGIFGSMFLGSYNVKRFNCTGINQNISVASMALGPDALDEIYTNLPSVTSKTITVTSNWGTASDDPTIATAKGWTVTG